MCRRDAGGRLRVPHGRRARCRCRGSRPAPTTRANNSRPDRCADAPMNPKWRRAIAARSPVRQVPHQPRRAPHSATRWEHGAHPPAHSANPAHTAHPPHAGHAARRTHGTATGAGRPPRAHPCWRSCEISPQRKFRLSEAWEPTCAPPTPTPSVAPSPAPCPALRGALVARAGGSRSRARRASRWRGVRGERRLSSRRRRRGCPSGG